MIDITPLILFACTIIFGMIAYYIKKYVVPFLEEKLTGEQRENLYKAVVVGVKAAEQLYKNGSIAKNERLAQVKRFLNANHITYDETVVNNMIESAVRELPKTLKKEEVKAE